MEIVRDDRYHTLENNMQTEAYEDPESGYASGRSSLASFSNPPRITLTELHLKHLNEQFERFAPQEILRMSKLVFPNLYQTTAFGLTGLVMLDMLYKLHSETPGASPVEIIFLDTLYHFEETHQLVARVKERYPEAKIHTFRPDGCGSTSKFEERYGHKLWETDGERYDYLAKVEPQQRSHNLLNVAAVFTGRRRSQGATRRNIPVLEVDHEMGVVKINPLVNWSFNQVQEYIKTNGVPYNELLDRGYKSVGDWHSTQPIADGEDERAGRWKGQQKTECGIHHKKSRYAVFLRELAKRQDERQDEERAETDRATQAANPKETVGSIVNMAVDPAPKAASPKAAEEDVVVLVSPSGVPKMTKPGRKIGFSLGPATARYTCLVQ
ncbi:Phosphoadenosine phosphosulfate reductase family-domain-containing protein [Xylaria digitata]|nr:Phosphoadenosine phosphosulfate reductase family-domain-containing protein [Xylaria digitata]